MLAARARDGSPPVVARGGGGGWEGDKGEGVEWSCPYFFSLL